MTDERITCAQCGYVLSENEVYEFDDETLCVDCYEEQTFVCARCDERFWRDDNAGDENTLLCQNCYDYHYTTCERCGSIIHNDDCCYEEDDEDNNRPYCHSCYSSNDHNRYLHEYGYKPEPIFYGEGNRFFGVELEIDYAGKDNECARQITESANADATHIYIKSDGSLEDGMEIVTHPISLDYHTHQMPWNAILQKALALGYQSHKTSTCGLHVHVNKSCFSDDCKQQDECIGRVLFFIERFWEEMLRFSRRTQDQMNRWSARYGYKDKPREILDHAKKGYGGRYTCVNLHNYHTIEFRMFRGTLKLSTIIATLQMINEICNVAILMSDEQLSAMSWCEFMERLSLKDYPELIQYLKERRLYINEPVAAEEDC